MDVEEVTETWPFLLPGAGERPFSILTNHSLYNILIQEYYLIRINL